MKLLISLSLSLFLSINLLGQKIDKPGPKDKVVTEHFKNDYKKKNYKKFSGKITVKDNQAQFDDKIIFYDKSDKITKLLLQEGLIYPQLLTDYQMQKFLDETEDKTQKRFLKLQKDPKAGFDVNGIKFTNTSEVGFLTTSPQVKRFKIQCKDSRISSTLTYFIELTNKDANDKVSLEDFIKGSKLTYVYQRPE